MHIGVDFAYKLIQVNRNKIVRLQLWDIAGQERYGNMTRVYYREAVGAFIVFDVSRLSTFEAVKKWKADIDAKVRLPDPNESPIPVVLLANKCDLVKDATNPQEMDAFCAENGFVGWFETSAKENINIDRSANFLVQKILETESQSHDAPHDPNAVDPAKGTRGAAATGSGDAQGSAKGCQC